MRRIGILTFNRATNYGAVLQAYAMKQVCEKLGYETHVVDYSVEKDVQPRPFRAFLASRRGAGDLVKLVKALVALPWSRRRWKVFRSFRKTYLDETEPCKDASAVSALGFDAYVMGSDQIWNYRITKGSFDPVFFGILPGDAASVVYGASSHDTPFPLNKELELEDLLVQTKAAVSIREKQLADYAAQISGRRFPTVLDPTLLGGREVFTPIEKRLPVREPYILLYQIDANPLSDISISSLEKCFGRRVYSMTVPKLGSMRGKKGYFGPEAFLSMLEHADFVVTNSFHGVALSLLWHKQFFVYENGGVMTRIDDLLASVELTDRKVRMTADINLTNTVDYDMIDPLLQKERVRSLAFLSDALAGKANAPIPEQKREGQAPAPFLDRAKESCSGCSACVEVCPVAAIRMEADREGFLYPTIDTDACIRCGRCDSFCSFIPAPRRDRKNLPHAFGVKHKDLSIRKASRSGGMFVALSDRILQRGGVVYGAVQSPDGIVRHARAQTREERDRMQGAKYVQSDMTGVIPQLIEDLSEGREVLFSGTPCQVAGVRSLLRFKKINDSKLLTCDLVCHGTPSPMIWADYRKWIEQKYGDRIVKADFRDKSFGWDSHCESFLMENGKKVVRRDYTDLFYAHLTFRPSCHYCRFSNVNRVGDISLADFWGIEKNDRSFEDPYGVSLVLVNTDRGMEAFEAVKNDVEAFSCDVLNCLQPTLTRPSAPSPRRSAFWESYRHLGFEKTMKRFVRPDSMDKRIKRNLKKLLFLAGVRDHP